ncbi:unnamed protein product [Lactuca virosa]|uniref:pyridoxal kinase n=1 Tax=Lactuca virosa TaxID=75947 RepID=A0AAU9MHI0_9ASTR|nr:unnamed protein product [Lactuca virosa]
MIRLQNSLYNNFRSESIAFRRLSYFRARSSKKDSRKMAPPILSLALPSETGRVLSIQSHTVQGYVGNKSAVFPLQLLGYDVDPIMSVQFSNHTGYPTFKGQVLNGKQLWELIEGLEANNLLHYTHLLTGYIGSVSFLENVLEVVKKLRSINPNLTYVCDPVMGDEGKLYVPQELVSVYREKVVPIASMLTPNQFEAEQLTGLKIASEQDGREACRHLHAAGPSKVVITSISIDGNLLLIGSHQKQKDQSPLQFKIVIPKIPAYFTGTGDLMTALLLGWSNKYPENLDKAAELAVSSLQAVLSRTLEDYEKAGQGEASDDDDGDEESSKTSISDKKGGGCDCPDLRRHTSSQTWASHFKISLLFYRRLQFFRLPTLEASLLRSSTVRSFLISDQNRRPLLRSQDLLSGRRRRIASPISTENEQISC